MRWLFLLLFLFIGRADAMLGGAGAPGVATIVIDPGHGGSDMGARAQPPYCEEKRLCLQTARLLKKYLNQLGYHVVLTRNTDAFIPLPKRVEIATQALGDLFVSVHFNSSRKPAAKGIEIFFHENSDEPKKSNSSRRLADSILRRLIRRTSAVSRGVKKGNFFVIRETMMPAVLVEGGFLSNPEERSRLKNKEYQELLARGIADGIHFFMKQRR